LISIQLRRDLIWQCCTPSSHQIWLLNLQISTIVEHKPVPSSQ
jgi:hypothetical protein